MKFTQFADKFSGQAGINSLMDDLGKALAGDQPMIMMGGGNPGHLEPVQARLREELAAIAADPLAFQRLVGIYDAPQGEARFITALKDLLNATYGWGLAEILAHRQRVLEKARQQHPERWGSRPIRNCDPVEIVSLNPDTEKVEKAAA